MHAARFMAVRPSDFFFDLMCACCDSEAQADAHHAQPLPEANNSALPMGAGLAVLATAAAGVAARPPVVYHLSAQGCFLPRCSIPLPRRKDLQVRFRGTWAKARFFLTCRVLARPSIFSASMG